MLTSKLPLTRYDGRTLIGTAATVVAATQCCISPRDATIEFAEGFQQLAWRINVDVLAKKLACLTGVPITRTIGFESALALNNSRASSLSFIMHCILLHLAQPQSSSHALVLEELELALIVSLLCNGEHNFRYLLDGVTRSAAPREVRRVDVYIEANWDKPFRVEDMSAITNSSVRSIYRAFRSSRGYSPMELVKRQRLLQAHHLLKDPDCGITAAEAAPPAVRRVHAVQPVAALQTEYLLINGDTYN